MRSVSADDNFSLAAIQSYHPFYLKAKMSMNSIISVSPVWSLANIDKSSISNDSDGKFSMENCIYLKNNHESLNHITDISMWIEFTAPKLKREEYTYTVKDINILVVP